MKLIPTAIKNRLPAPIRNYFWSQEVIQTTKDAALRTGTKQADEKKNIKGYIFPAPIVRVRWDIARWRRALEEIERPWYPHRVEAQYMFADTILWGHVEACWNRRKDLSLLRDFKFVNSAGVENEDLKKLFEKKPWFQNFMSFALDAQGFGYSLIALGDIVNDAFPNMEVIKRWNISPDRLNVTPFTYSISGINFLEDPDVKQWHIWVPTVNEIGSSICGYGLFYKIAIYAIYLRNNLGFNVDYAENFGQPMRVGTTTKTEEDERADFANALAAMGAEAWILKDPTDEVELVESKSTGQGFKVYESIESRCEKTISKMVLGHADALDSVPGKLGSGQGDDNPVYQALCDKQTKDAQFLEPIINTELLPRMRELGFDIPADIYFEFTNDDEKEQFRQRQDASNKVTAEIAQTMKDAGLKMSPKYFAERTGIECEEIEDEETDISKTDPGIIKTAIKNKLARIYGN